MKSFMKRWLPIILIGVFASMSLSSCAVIKPGWVGVKVDNWGANKGVEDYPLQTGVVGFNIFTENIYEFPTFQQTYSYTKDKEEGSPSDESMTFNSIEGAVINADVAVSMSFERDRVPHVFVKFRKTAEDILHSYVRSEIRDAFSRVASTMKVTEIFGARKQELLNKVKAMLEAELGPIGMKFDFVTFIGALRVDPDVQASIHAVIIATQKATEAQNKIVQSTAESEQKIRTSYGDSLSMVRVAQAQARSNDFVGESLRRNPEVLRWALVQKWDGRRPMVEGGGGLGSLINIPIAPQK